MALGRVTSLKEQVLARLSLRQVAEQAGARFRGDRAACPLHGGDNPTAFELYAGGARWQCHTRCPAGRNAGDLFDFYRAWKGVDFPTALHDLAEMAGVRAKREGREEENREAARRKTEEKEDLKRPSSTLAPSRPELRALRVEPPSPWHARAQDFIAFARAQLWDPQAGKAAREYLAQVRGLDEFTWDYFDLGYNPATLYDEPERWGLSSQQSKKVWLPRGIVIPGRSFVTGAACYVKVRRPLPGDPLAGFLEPDPGAPGAKFVQVRGGRGCLFGSQTLRIGEAELYSYDTILLVEGEWDAMLAWRTALDLCDFATLGSASSRPDAAGLAFLNRYGRVLAVYDADAAGEAARRRLAALRRVQAVRPPAHDLSDYALAGGDLREWILAQARGTPEVSAGR